MRRASFRPSTHTPTPPHTHMHTHEHTQPPARQPPSRATQASRAPAPALPRTHSRAPAHMRPQPAPAPAHPSRYPTAPTSAAASHHPPTPRRKRSRPLAAHQPGCTSGAARHVHCRSEGEDYSLPAADPSPTPPRRTPPLCPASQHTPAAESRPQANAQGHARRRPQHICCRRATLVPPAPAHTWGRLPPCSAPRCAASLLRSGLLKFHSTLFFTKTKNSGLNN